VDSNVVRISSRYFGIKTSKEGRRDRYIIEMAKNYVSKGNPRNNNLALLDFGALTCTPRNPRCQKCILSKTCHYKI
jgi:A/G-specific adenine glycosylase